MPAKKSPTKNKTTAKTATPPKTTVKKVSTKKKASTQKITKKKTSTKQPTKKSKKDLTQAEGPMAFWVTDGTILYNLLDLVSALEEMADDHYTYHAKGDQNDFSIWVETTLCDSECAKDLAKAKDKKKAITVVKRHLKVYSI